MSRSNPTENQPHPCTRWFEWSGESGTLAYYDKVKEEKINIGSKFKFILLDSLAVVKGWHDPSESGITSNEVRDTKAERMVVKAFKGGILAEGFYASIRDRVKSVGGHFTSNLYIAFKGEQGLQLGSLQLKGAALNAWVDFSKDNRAVLYKKAITITGFEEGKKGKITSRVPVFKSVELAPESDAEAGKIDKDILQPYLAGYFKRTRIDQVSAPAAAEPPQGDDEPPVSEPGPEAQPDEPPTDDSDSVPF